MRATFVSGRNISFAILLVGALSPIFLFEKPEHINWHFDLNASGVCRLSPSDQANIRIRNVAPIGLTPFIHAPSVVETKSGIILAVWYGGSREGSSDTRIFGAELKPGGKNWSQSRVLVDRHATASSVNLPIRRLGNPVVSRDPSGQLWLFFVSTSIGGWATSAINVMRSADDGRTWTRPKRLFTSPFLNISTLVKGAPVFFKDGTMGLPVYHEFLGKFAELLRIDRSGRVVSKVRLTWGRRALQPIIVPLAEQRGVALMRDSRDENGRVLLVRTNNGGQDWTPVEESSLPNPNSAVAAAKIGPKGLALVFNNSATSRSPLELAMSHDEGKSWRRVIGLDQSTGGQPPGSLPNSTALDYPFAFCTRNGRLQIVFARGHRSIRHIVIGDRPEVSR